MDLQSQKTAIIDADSICYIAHWDTNSKSFDKPLEDIYKAINQIISNILINTMSNKYIGFVGMTRDYKRLEVYPDYKANRSKLEPLKHINDIKSYMIDTWEFHPVYGVEVDDIVNSVRLKVENSVLCAIDKDLLMLEGTHYNYKKNEWIITSEEEAIKYFWKSMIIGDVADNIKGIKGKGADFANKLFINIDDEASMRTLVFDEYINRYDEYEGIQKFYENYICLKIRSNCPVIGFLTPTELDVNKLVA